SGQPIQFTTPDGQTVSNALLPAAQAPGTQELPDMPDAQADHVFTPRLPGQWMPLPRRMPVNPRDSQDSQDGTDIRSRMGVQTPAEMMGLPTLREMFGLPKTTATNSVTRYGSTNILSSDEESQQQSEESSWAKILSAEADSFNSTRPDSNSVDKGFFDSASADGLFHDKKSDDNKSGDSLSGDNMFGTAQPAQTDDRQKGWDTAVQIAAPETAPAVTMTPTLAPPPAPAFNASSLSPPSPFALPKNDSIAVMPQLPTLPSVPGQSIAPPPPATPSWAPKPPPWASSTPSLGNIEQRKF
ncbi:MAG TPA: hypothetical protein VMO20_07175, partial [Candidatus Acidoferrum sp.]|nr:hypothetical protein [Candidatus Acidoferrum sp.]